MGNCTFVVVKTEMNGISRSIQIEIFTAACALSLTLSELQTAASRDFHLWSQNTWIFS